MSFHLLKQMARARKKPITTMAKTSLDRKKRKRNGASEGQSSGKSSSDFSSSLEEFG